ncbi:MAG: galactokinase [Acidobacteriota bacterium]
MTRLLEAFEREFGAGGEVYLARAPGRVNLMGDHTDYNGLPVLPLAIQRKIEILFRPRTDSRVRLRNICPAFAPRDFSLQAPIAAYERGDWGNYTKAAAQALLERFGSLRGIDALISGDIPLAAGLSSSSALVVASALALLAANEISMEPLELMDLTASGEHFVGTRGGGMDQAICLGGLKGQALKIEFQPLQLTSIPIPPGWRFIVAHSLVAADKSGAANHKYNQRTVQCREALQQIHRDPGLRALPGTYPALLKEGLPDDLIAIANESLTEPYRGRFRHVITEAGRVEDATAALLAADVKKFGRLMDASHASLSRDFEVSCPELDELVQACKDSGARGARMTGGGFGGCAVALCEEAQTEELLRSLEDRFYRTRAARQRFSEYLIPIEAVSGASVLSSLLKRSPTALR